ncbi:unnamed protein product [Linum trigynum]|uniref:Uncharacterized protein n=1 Tax=Linum trigynum TaxID=586398 RepID=A0AAV2D668_9ROSI
MWEQRRRTKSLGAKWRCDEPAVTRWRLNARQAAEGGGAPTSAVEMAEGSVREGGETVMATGEREEREREDGGVMVFFLFIL